MNIKNRIKTVSFWLSTIGAIIMMIEAFGVRIPVAEVQYAVNAVCAALVMMGILTDSKSAVTGNLGGTEKAEEVGENSQSDAVEQIEQISVIADTLNQVASEKPSEDNASEEK